MGVLNRQQLLERRRPLAFEDVLTPELGENGDGQVTTVRIRELTVNERERWGRAAYNQDGEAQPNFRARLVAFCAVDTDGARLFEDSDEDLATIAGLSGALGERLVLAAMRLNGMGTKPEDGPKN